MYRALYRKHRPLKFEDVVGQQHIVDTIKNQVACNKISHAYMFTGTRGTGKTTCAKILARAVNCERPVNGDPCNECPTCKAILNGSCLDVFEIDAASNNGVDNIRELREDVIFTPADVRYKVYIIDEVHMLSNQAFNALLKTLEEPPEHIIFIFATTEINKVPQTILSRCQRFDFRRITQDDIKKRLMYVADCEKFMLDEDAALLIAKLADGAMRDALSILDRCANGNSSISLETVESIMGMCPYEEMADALEAIADDDTERLLLFYAECKRNSKDTVSLFSQLCSYYRDMIILKLTKNPDKLLSYDRDKINKLKSVSQKYTLAKISRCIKLLQNGIYDVLKLKDKHIIAELTLIKITQPELGNDYDDINARVSKLEKLSPVLPSKRTPTQECSTQPVKAKTHTEKSPAHNSDTDCNFKDKFLDVISALGGQSILPFLASGDIVCNGDKLYIICSKNDFEYSVLNKPENISLLEQAAKRASGTEYAVRFREPGSSAAIKNNDLLGELMSNADDILYEE